MDEGSDAVLNSEDNGFEHLSVPKDDSSSTDQEEDLRMDSPDPVEPKIGKDVGEPYSEGFPEAPKPESGPVPTGVEDVRRERKEGKRRRARMVCRANQCTWGDG